MPVATSSQFRSGSSPQFATQQLSGCGWGRGGSWAGNRNGHRKARDEVSRCARSTLCSHQLLLATLTTYIITMTTHHQYTSLSSRVYKMHRVPVRCMIIALYGIVSRQPFPRRIAAARQTLASNLTAFIQIYWVNGFFCSVH